MKQWKKRRVRNEVINLTPGYQGSLPVYKPFVQVRSPVSADICMNNTLLSTLSPLILRRSLFPIEGFIQTETMRMINRRTNSRVLDVLYLFRYLLFYKTFIRYLVPIEALLSLVLSLLLWIFPWDSFFLSDANNLFLCILYFNFTFFWRHVNIADVTAAVNAPVKSITVIPLLFDYSHLPEANNRMGAARAHGKMWASFVDFFPFYLTELYIFSVSCMLH